MSSSLFVFFFVETKKKIISRRPKVPTHDHPGRTLCPGGGEVPKGSIIVKEATYRCGKEIVGVGKQS